MRTIALSLVLGLAACGSSGDDGQKAKLASDLVTCKNEVSTLKEQLADAKAALAKAQEAAGQMVKLDPMEIKIAAQAAAPGKRMDANISPESVAKVLKQNGSGLSVCYQHALKRKPDLQYVSTVTVHFQLKSEGRATQVRFTPHTDQELERCMAGTVEKWKFPSFQGDPVGIEQPVSLVAK